MSTLTARTDALVPSAFGQSIRSLLPPVVGIAMALVLQFALKPAINPFYVKILMDAGIAIILAVSLNIVNGFTGQFSIGHAGFMAVGGYVAAVVTYYGSYRLWGASDLRPGFLGAGEWLFVLGCLAGGLAAAATGFVVGLPSLRLRGDYLAIVTLGFGEIIRVLLQQSGDVLFLNDEVAATPFWKLCTKLGGSLGFTGLAYYSSLFWVYAFAALALIAAFRLKQSSYGRAFLSIREDEIAAEAMGIPTTRVKVAAFVLSAGMAGIAGGLFAHEEGVTLNPQDLGFVKSFDIIIMVVLGGMGSISGATVAAVLLTLLPELLRSLAGPVVAALAAVFTISEPVQEDLKQLIGNNFRMILYALALIVMMIARPQGLFGVREVWELGRRANRPPRSARP